MIAVISGSRNVSLDTIDCLLSSALQEYTSHYRKWDMPSPSVKILCPIDPEKIGKKSMGQEGEEDDSSKEEDNERKRRRNYFGARPRVEQGLMPPSLAHAINVNGRRILLCNFNGVMIQVGLSLSLSLSLTHTHTHTHTHTRFLWKAMIVMVITEMDTALMKMDGRGLVQTLLQVMMILL